MHGRKKGLNEGRKLEAKRKEKVEARSEEN